MRQSPWSKAALWLDCDECHSGVSSHGAWPARPCMSCSWPLPIRKLEHRWHAKLRPGHGHRSPLTCSVKTPSNVFTS